MDAQLKKGVLELSILQEIDKKDIYGYELVRMLSDYYIDVDTSSFYTILRRLKRKEYVESYSGTCSGGPQRKYYRLTLSGKDYLQNKLKDYRRLHEIQQQLGMQ